MEILTAILLIPAYLFVFLCFGLLLPSRGNARTAADVILPGFMLYFSLFQLIAFPLKLAGARLDWLVIVWAAAVGTVCVFVIIRRRSSLKKALLSPAKVLSEEKGLIFFALLFSAFALFLALNINHLSDYDAGYYIGLPVSSLVSGTIERMNPNTGKALSQAHPFYLLNTVTVHCAVVCRHLPITPLVEEKFTFTAVVSLLFDLFLYKAGRFLFPGKRTAACFFASLAITVIFFTYSLAGVSQYFAYRTYEGKSICSFLYMTAVFVFFLGIYYKKYSSWGWTGLFLTCLSAIAFCNSALLTVPLLAGALLLPTIVLERSYRSFWYMFLALLPAAAWLAVYAIL